MLRWLTNAADGGDGAELVDDVPRQEVDVVVRQPDAGVAHAVTSQLVQLGVLHPVDGLWIICGSRAGYILSMAGPTGAQEHALSICIFHENYEH